MEARYSEIAEAWKAQVQLTSRGSSRAKQDARCGVVGGCVAPHNSKHSDDPRARSIHNAVLRQSSVVTSMFARPAYAAHM